MDEHPDVEELLKQKDAAYRERNMCVVAIAKLAMSLGYTAGIGGHPLDDLDWDPEWRTIIYIDLPSGQVSWHVHDSERMMFSFLPTYEKKWDGHTTEEKYERVINPEGA